MTVTIDITPIIQPVFLNSKPIECP